VPGLDWSAAETAAHLVADLREHAALATGAHGPPDLTSPIVDRRNAAERGAAANQAQLDAFPERDLTVLADCSKTSPGVAQLSPPAGRERSSR
jgi:hypothetical protein